MTGINWIKESGFLEGPILLTVDTRKFSIALDPALQRFSGTRCSLGLSSERCVTRCRLAEKTRPHTLDDHDSCVPLATSRLKLCETASHILRRWNRAR